MTPLTPTPPTLLRREGVMLRATCQAATGLLLLVTSRLRASSASTLPRDTHDRRALQVGTSEWRRGTPAVSCASFSRDGNCRSSFARDQRASRRMKAENRAFDARNAAFSSRLMLLVLKKLRLRSALWSLLGIQIDKVAEITSDKLECGTGHLTRLVINEWRNNVKMIKMEQ